MQNLLLFKSRRKFFSNGKNDSKTTVVEAIYFKKTKNLYSHKYKIYQFERGLTQLHFEVPIQQNKRISVKYTALQLRSQVFLMEGNVKDCRIILPSSLASRRALIMWKCETTRVINDLHNNFKHYFYSSLLIYSVV